MVYAHLYFYVSFIKYSIEIGFKYITCETNHVVVGSFFLRCLYIMRIIKTYTFYNAKVLLPIFFFQKSKVKPILFFNPLIQPKQKQIADSSHFSINVFKSLKIFMWSHNLTFLRHMEKETVKKFFLDIFFCERKGKF